MSKPHFKPYIQNQPYLIPPSWDEYILPNHPVRVVDAIVEQIDLDELYQTYKTIGNSSYSPKMLLKLIIYSYLNNIYSSRKIEESSRSSLFCIWLCGGNIPDHNTISRFRQIKVDVILKDIFKKIVLLLAEQGLVSLDEVYVDGTKIEANANKFTFVWKNSIKYYKEQMIKQIDEVWNYAQQINKKELSDSSPISYDEISAEKILETVKQIEEAIKDKVIDDKQKKKIKYIKKNYPTKIEEYKKKEEILAERNSFSKTDVDATFMRTKDDHFQNGQLKPCYNAQITTNNQIITSFGIYQTPGDTGTFEPQMEKFKELYGKNPKVAVTDAGYGSEQNYEFAESEDIEAYLKYNTFYQEVTGKHQKLHPFAQQYLHYNQEENYFICPMGQKMIHIEDFTRKTLRGYSKIISRYEAQNCEGCSLKGKCHKREGNRVLEVNHKLRRYKLIAKEKLLSEEGIKFCKQRSIDVETVFGNIKQNKNFRKFSLRGITKVSIEFGLVALAHNLSKLCAVY